MFNVSGIKIAVNLAIANAGATSHFLLAGAPIVDKRPARMPLQIHLPDSNILKSTHTGRLALTDLPSAARKAHVVPGLTHSLLISINVLCNAGCVVAYTADTCEVKLNKRLL